MKNSILTKHQVKTLSKVCTIDGERGTFKVGIRYDDQCGNGHNTFAITGAFYPDSLKNSRDPISFCGCCHEKIAKHFPELAPLIKWHLTSSDGPMHYIANTIYHAGDIDHNGNTATTKKQIRNGRTGKLCWQLKLISPEKLPQEMPDADEKPAGFTAIYDYAPLTHDTNGKPREFNHARSSAVWPEATDEQLSLPAEELKALLIARHPQLMADFQAAVESLGFIY